MLDEKTIKWPDYLGKFLFNTLGKISRTRLTMSGNIQKYPKTGLLFMDFDTGDLLQVSGQAKILYNDTSMPGSQRMVEFEVEEALYFKQVVPLNWEFINSSPFNPEVSVFKI